MMQVMARVLNWIGKACNQLYWARHYFIFPPDENNAQEMAVYQRRLSNWDTTIVRHEPHS